MYQFGKAVGVVETKDGFKVGIYLRGGLSYMCNLTDDGWKDCVFPTEHEAQQEADRYNEFSWKET